MSVPNTPVILTGKAPVPQRMIEHALRLAFIVQTADDPVRGRRAVESIPMRMRDDVMEALAWFVDIDARDMHGNLRVTTPPPPTVDPDTLARARWIALQPLWDAYQYGDRHPDVVAGWSEYVAYLAACEAEERDDFLAAKDAA